MNLINKKRILLITNLKDKNKNYLKKSLVAISDGCIKYQDKDFSKADLLVSRKYLKKNHLLKDFSYIKGIYNSYLLKISSQLNKIHKVNYPTEYWRIIVGHWLERFIFIIYDRLKSIQQIKKNYKILFVKIANEKKKLYEYNDYNDFNSAILNQDQWNNLIYKDILKILKYFPIKKFNYIPYKKNERKKNERKINLRKILIDFILIIFTYINSHINKKKYFIIGAYLSLKDLILLQLKLRQFPYFAKENIQLKFRTNKNLRSWNKRDSFWNEVRKKNLISILDALIPKHIPKIYLEGYKYTVKFIDTLNWPTKPKFIFSSISFYNDDIFKIYLAEQKIKHKTKFISIQHGGVFFSSKFFFSQSLQSKISNTFMTWGYKKKFSTKFLPMFNLSNKDKKIHYKKNGKLLFVNYEFPRFPFGIGSPLFTDSRNIELLEDCFNFFKKLKYNVINSSIIKMYPHDFGWNIQRRFNSNGIFCDFSKRNDSFFKLLNNSRLCVTNIDSTAYLQSLNFNFPTIIFFNKDLSIMTDEFLRDLKVLKKAKVFFDTPEQAAIHINLVWDAIEEWWDSKKVQKAVTFFCEKYSKRSNDRINDLYNHFKSYN
jgi:putative transferase (TIGR04331 family)